MGSVSNPKTWVPYMNTRDCSQGFCSLYCPQWCYIIFPPPPPFDFPDENSGPSFSPLVIAIIGILASAFLLVSYYAIISKFCGNRNASRRRDNHHDHDTDLEDNQDPSHHEPWHAATNGLDEALIKSIAVFKYKKGDGLVEGADCSVCLSEFQDDENLRLLPKCSHAFHVGCIDTWLKSHSNCPLCRANIVFVNPSLSEVASPIAEIRQINEPPRQSHPDNGNLNAFTDIEAAVTEEEISQSFQKNPIREHNSQLENLSFGSRRAEIRDNESDQQIRRSVSMDCSCEGRLSIADVLRVDHEAQYEMEEESHFRGDIGTSSKGSVIETGKPDNRSRVVNPVTSPVAMKRSFSSGRFLFSKHERRRNPTIPL